MFPTAKENCIGFRKAYLKFLKVVLCLSLILSPNYTYAQSLSPEALGLPPLGHMVSTTDSYIPMTMKGLTIYSQDPFKFDFIMNTGDSGLEGEAFREEARKIILYFLATLTTPEEEMWVNLSPEEKDRIIPDQLGRTELGVAMLSQDYVLKQLTASMIYPDHDLGRDFWDRTYKKVSELYGHTDIPVNTFNKIWIFPDEAEVYESQDSAFVVRQHLKVMLEDDYKVLKSHMKNNHLGMGKIQEKDAVVLQDAAADVVREVLIPEIEREVNHGKNFAKLRQIFSAMI